MIGPRIAQLREEAGWTQAELAKRIGTSQSAVSQIEKGIKTPSFSTIRQVADALGVTPGYVIGGEVESLTPEEEIHFRQYRSLPPQAREELQTYLQFLRTKHGASEK
jgi:transcriptional regulator with XRE-family HTH domain